MGVDLHDAPWLGVGSGAAGLPDSRRLGTVLAPAPADVVASVLLEGLRVDGAADLGTRPSAADEIVGLVPDLASIVRRIIAHVHPLVSEPGYDVSHSQPCWPDRIFVSFPGRDDDVGNLRLAESVVHEAMHLLLTEEERLGPLVADDGERLWSPWMRMDRAVGGVLHGLFVFLCIRAFLERLARITLAEDLLRHCSGRIAELSAEVAVVDRVDLVRSLTPGGAELVARWTRSDRAHRP